MERSLESKRTLRWKRRNDITYNDVGIRILKYCKVIFGFEKYNIIDINPNKKGLQIFKNEESFMSFLLYLDEEELCLKVVNNRQGNILKKYIKEDCWLKALQDISEEIKK